MSKNIVFLGIKHCGKSTHGKLLAERLDRRFLDTDDMLSMAYQEKFGCPAAEAAPREIMKKHGEEFFRKFEAQVIRDYLEKNRDNGDVLALGGGVPCNDFLSTSELKSLGVMLHLAISADTAFKRIAAGGIPPFLQGDDPYAKFLAMYDKRLPRYNEIADIVINLPEEPVKSEIAELIYNTLKEKKFLENI
ncbi:MAG: hypothetical protein IKA65_02340 [Lentisphaeria bacterium]|nr:hypothetical protein [Lentisphaeria bacterium]